MTLIFVKHSNRVFPHPHVVSLYVRKNSLLTSDWIEIVDGELTLI